MKCSSSPLRERKCQQLLDAAEQLIEEQGIISFRFTDIAKVARLSAGASYKLFDSKEDVLLCLLLRTSTLNNIPDIFRDQSDLSPQQRLLIPILTTLHTEINSSGYAALRSVSVNSKVWPLASSEKSTRFKLGANLHFGLIHTLLIEARDSGALNEGDERILLLARMIYFQLYGQSTAYESGLYDSLAQESRHQVQLQAMLTLINAFNWPTPVTHEDVRKIDRQVTQYFARGLKDKLSCKKCLDANLQIRRLS